jgi:hypothetical protein
LKGNTTVDSDRLFAAGRFMNADRSNYSIASYFPLGVTASSASGGGIELPSQVGRYGLDDEFNIISRSRMRPAAIFMPEIGPIRFTDQYYRKPSTGSTLYVTDDISFPITAISRSGAVPAVAEDMYFTISGGGNNCLICPGMIVTISGNAGGIPNGESKYVQAVGSGRIILGYSSQPLFGGTYILGEGYYNPTVTTFESGSSIVLSKTANTGLFIGGKYGLNGRDTSLTASGGLILGNYLNGQPGKISTASSVSGLNITSVSGPIQLFGETGGVRLTVPQAAGTAVSVSGGLNVSGGMNVSGIANFLGNSTLTALSVSGASTIVGTLNVSGGTTVSGVANFLGNSTLTALSVSGASTIVGTLNVSGGTTVSGVANFLGNATLTTLNVSGVANFSGNISQSGNSAFTTGTGSVALNGNTNVSGTLNVVSGGKTGKVFGVVDYGSISNTGSTGTFYSMNGFPAGVYSFSTSQAGYNTHMPILVWTGSGFSASFVGYGYEAGNVGTNGTVANTGTGTYIHYRTNSSGTNTVYYVLTRLQ